jgi:hypothetical protein
MPITVSPNEYDVHVALTNFLAGIGLFVSAPQTAIEIVLGQDNRVPEPVGPDFMEFWPLHRLRLSTNYDDFIDTFFTGSITATTLTVTAVAYGAIGVGSPIFGPTVAAGTSVTALGTGTGGVGTYTVSASQAVSSGPLAAGLKSVEQDSTTTYQIDVHGPNSADNAALITSLFRDQYGVDAFSAATGVSPLYADDPRQMAFINAEQQFEDRWIVDATMQVSQIITGIPQRFFTSAVISAISAK